MDKRLGRGLGSLLGAPVPETEETPNVAGAASLPIDQIRTNRYQPRKTFDPAGLEELRDSIRTHGILQPVVVRQTPLGYELIVGERRWRGARLAGLREIPAIVRTEVPDSEMLELALVENVQRRDLDALEKARGYQQMIDQLKLTQEQVAERVGLKRATIANHLRLLDLEEDGQQALAEGLITMGHARALLGVRDEGKRGALLARIVREGLSVRQTEASVQSLTALRTTEVTDPDSTSRPGQSDRAADLKAGGVKPGGLKPEEPWVRELQRQMQLHLGTKVSLANGPGYVGKIVIEYYSREDLDRLVEVLAPKEGL